MQAHPDNLTTGRVSVSERKLANAKLKIVFLQIDALLILIKKGQQASIFILTIRIKSNKINLFNRKENSGK